MDVLITAGLMVVALVWGCSANNTTANSTEMCPCDCEYMDKIEYWNNHSNEYVNMTLLEIYEALLPQLEETKKKLAANVKELSSFKATKISAPDERPSAKQVGVLGITFFCVFFAIIILVDLSSCKKHLNTMKICRKRL